MTQQPKHELSAGKKANGVNTAEKQGYTVLLQHVRKKIKSIVWYSLTGLDSLFGQKRNSL